MNYRFVAGAALFAAASLFTAAQTPTNTGKSKAATTSKASKTGAYKTPKTPWGDPDLQGLWPGTYNISFQRPASMGERAVLNDDELKLRGKQSQDRSETGKWHDYYPPHPQASLVIDPPNGRVPPYTEEGAKRIKGVREGRGPASMNTPNNGADWVTDYDLWGRCVTKGLIGSIVPGGNYNKGNQIVQAPGVFVIRNEMVHETRVIPLDGRPHAGSNIHMFMGDGRGHWEGDTLVVETTNFTDKTNVNSFDASFGPHSDQLKLTEKWQRLGPEELSYTATLDDPATWTRPWTMHIPFKMDNDYKLYEYACHEANYDILQGLKGSRVREQEAAGRKD